MVCSYVVSPRPEQTFASAPHPTRLPPFHLTVRQVIFSLLGSRLPAVECRLPVSTETPASGPRGLLRPTSLSIAISSINNTNSRNEPQVTQASKLYDGICSDTHLETHCFVPDPRNPGFTSRYNRLQQQLRRRGTLRASIPTPVLLAYEALFSYLCDVIMKLKILKSNRRNTLVSVLVSSAR